VRRVLLTFIATASAGGLIAACAGAASTYFARLARDGKHQRDPAASKKRLQTHELRHDLALTGNISVLASPPRDATV